MSYKVEYFTYKNRNLDINIHQINSNKIILICPGFNETIDGYNNKYGKLSDFIQRKNLANVVRTYNINKEEKDYKNWIDNLQYTIDYVLNYFSFYKSSKDLELNLVGISSGSEPVSIISNKYSEIKKLLLISPRLDLEIKEIEKNLTKFQNDISIMVGANDKTDISNSLKYYYSAINSKKRQLKIIPNCDHWFTGENNSRILSKAPFWAFGKLKDFSTMRSSLKLYD